MLLLSLVGVNRIVGTSNSRVKPLELVDGRDKAES